jgi:hypothetical protein
MTVSPEWIAVALYVLGAVMLAALLAEERKERQLVLLRCVAMVLLWPIFAVYFVYCVLADVTI